MFEDKLNLPKELNRDDAVVYEDLSVYASLDDDPKIGYDGVLDNTWGLVGLLEDEASLGLKRSVDKEKIKAHKLGVVAVVTKPGELTGEFKIIGNNKLLDYIAFPDRSADGRILKHTKKVARLHIAYVGVRSNGDLFIRATRHKAYATIEDYNMNEKLEGVTVQLDFVTGADGDAFDEYIITNYKDQGDDGAGNDELLRFVEPEKVVKEEVKKVTKSLKFPAGVKGGTFTITVDDQTTTALKFNATTKQIDEALEALSSVKRAAVNGNIADGLELQLGLPLDGAGVVSANGGSLTGAASTTITVK